MSETKKLISIETLLKFDNAIFDSREKLYDWYMNSSIAHLEKRRWEVLIEIEEAESNDHFKDARRLEKLEANIHEIIELRSLKTS